MYLISKQERKPITQIPPLVKVNLIFAAAESILTLGRITKGCCREEFLLFLIELTLVAKCVGYYDYYYSREEPALIWNGGRFSRISLGWISSSVLLEAPSNGDGDFFLDRIHAQNLAR